MALDWNKPLITKCGQAVKVKHKHFDGKSYEVIIGSDSSSRSYHLDGIHFTRDETSRPVIINKKEKVELVKIDWNKPIRCFHTKKPARFDKQMTSDTKRVIVEGGHSLVVFDDSGSAWRVGSDMYEKGFRLENYEVAVTDEELAAKLRKAVKTLNEVRAELVKRGFSVRDKFNDHFGPFNIELKVFKTVTTKVEL